MKKLYVVLLCYIDLEFEKVSQVNLSNTHDGLVMTGAPELKSFLTAAAVRKD